MAKDPIEIHEAEPGVSERLMKALRERAEAKRREAQEAEDRLRIVHQEQHGSAATWTEPEAPPPTEATYRLLTDEEAMRAALGDATGQARVEIEALARQGIAATDAAYRENMRAGEGA